MGYEYHLDSALVKPTQERWLKLQDLILLLKSKRVLTARCLMSLIGLLASTEKMVPEGRLHMRPFQFHLKEHWRYPQSLDNLLPWTEAIAAHLDWWQNPSNVMKGADLHPKDHSIHSLLKRRLGRSLRPKFHKGSVVRSGKKATHICPRIEGGLPGPSRLQGPVPESNRVSCDGQLNSGSLHQQQGGTHSAEMCALLWKITTWGHHYLITLKARHVLGCLNVMADLLSRSNQEQSTEWSLHPQVFKQICQKWFTPHVDLFATHLNHKLPLYVSPIPDPRAWDIDALNINWTNLTAYAYPPTAPSQGDPKDQAMLLPDYRNSPRLARDALVLGPRAALNRDPTTTPSVNDPAQTVPQVCVPQQPPAPEPPRLVSRSGQLQEQGFSVEVAERIAAPQRSSTRTIYKSNGPYLKNGAEKIRWISPLHL